MRWCLTTAARCADRSSDLRPDSDGCWGNLRRTAVQGNVIGIEHCKPRAAHKGQNAVELPVAQPVLIPGVSLSPERDGPVVALGQLVLFSNDTGGAWLLDGTDQLAARRARDGDPEPIHLEQSNYQLRYRMERALAHRGPRLHLPRS